MRVIEVNMERRRNVEAGKTGDPRGSPPTSGVTRPGIEPDSPRWEANGLITQPPSPPPPNSLVSCILHQIVFYTDMHQSDLRFDDSNRGVELNRRRVDFDHANICVSDNIAQYRAVAVSEVLRIYSSCGTRTGPASFRHCGSPHLDMHFPNRCIGFGRPHSMAITSPDFWLLGHIKPMVYATPLGTRDELITRETFAHVRRNMLQRCTASVADGGVAMPVILAQHDFVSFWHQLSARRQRNDRVVVSISQSKGVREREAVLSSGCLVSLRQVPSSPIGRASYEQLTYLSVVVLYNAGSVARAKALEQRRGSSDSHTSQQLAGLRGCRDKARHVVSIFTAVGTLSDPQRKKKKKFTPSTGRASLLLLVSRISQPPPPPPPKSLFVARVPNPASTVMPESPPGRIEQAGVVQLQSIREPRRKTELKSRKPQHVGREDFAHIVKGPLFHICLANKYITYIKLLSTTIKYEKESFGHAHGYENCCTRSQALPEGVRIVTYAGAENPAGNGHLNYCGNRNPVSDFELTLSIIVLGAIRAIHSRLLRNQTMCIQLMNMWTVYAAQITCSYPGFTSGAERCDAARRVQRLQPATNVICVFTIELCSDAGRRRHMPCCHLLSYKEARNEMLKQNERHTEMLFFVFPVACDERQNHCSSLVQSPRRPSLASKLRLAEDRCIASRRSIVKTALQPRAMRLRSSVLQLSVSCGVNIELFTSKKQDNYQSVRRAKCMGELLAPAHSCQDRSIRLSRQFRSQRHCSKITYDRLGRSVLEVWIRESFRHYVSAIVGHVPDLLHFLRHKTRQL
ncbi:hypothetical protein PR048_006233 [Dryococelus australis]|uniref:Uncharacterized protein n=1 Tax=Dryococelus australis TaxID=614101 RepID=A0ABQ9ICL8_9NEOP|nr:hypothetical protein PR048_006233 [Dryococelus australis]